jgi:1-aminocyclopropane-1-carboxylate deaminase
MTDNFWNNNDPTPLQLVQDPVLEPFGVKLYLKRDDLIHAEIAGNKFRKLKYNLLIAKQLGFSKLLTFGGAFSNHIAATAAAGRLLGFQTVGIIRGDELTPTSNPTLRLAVDNGMKLIFVSRTDYQNKELLAQKYDSSAYILPEGGTNELAVEGVAECMTEIVAQLGCQPDFVTTAVGTGGTFAGLCAAAVMPTKVLGFAVLKNGQYLLPSINQLIDSKGDMSKANYEIFWDFHCGGYGKTNVALLKFMADFETRNGILLDPIYTAKMLFWLYELISRRDTFVPNDTIVAIHTGGLQGRTTSINTNQ